MQRVLPAIILFLLLCTNVVQAEEDTARVYVSIEGLNGRVLTNVVNLLSIQAYHQQLAPGDARVRYLHNQAPRDFRRALSPYGYYRYELERSLEQRNGDWYANYKITLGEPISYRQVSIAVQGEGQDDDAFQTLISSLNVRSGARLEHSDYESAKSRLRRLASDRGYYEARFTEQQLRIDMDAYAADVFLTLNTGPRYRFGEVAISEGHLDADVVRRFIGFSEGDYMQSSRLLDLQLGLSDSDYFSRIEVQPLWAEATDQQQVPIQIDYEPNKRTYYRFGIGYGTDTGSRLSFEQNRRWVNTRGHRFTAQVQASEMRSSVGANYTIPGQRPQTDQYVLRTLWTDENTDNTEYERIVFGVSWQKQFTRTERVLSLDWQDERDTLDGVIRKTQYLLPSAQWTRIHTQNRLDVDEGWRLSLTVRGAAAALLSDSDFAQTILAAKHVMPWGDKVRLLTRLDLGTSITGNFDQVPTSLRFYTGGDRTIRGYAYQSISPRNSLGEVEGGRHLIVGSAELDYEFRANWRVAAFFDAGNAFNNINDPMQMGVGIGFRWQSPVGPIRFDLASGLRDPGDTLRLHLTLGPDL